MLQNRIEDIRRRLLNASPCRLADNRLQLIAVSKKQTVDTIKEAADLGLRNFGENYVQEFLGKYESLKDLNLIWHFIGKLQSKKVKDVVNHFQWIHSVDRLSIAEKISQQADLKGRMPNILVQLNVAKEESKGGVYPEDLDELLDKVESLGGLRLRGLMVFPPQEKDVERAKRWCERSYDIFQQQQTRRGEAFSELSLGTSSDFEVAVAAGSTMVRLGEVLLGARGTGDSGKTLQTS